MSAIGQTFNCSEHWGPKDDLLEVTKYSPFWIQRKIDLLQSRTPTWYCQTMHSFAPGYSELLDNMRSTGGQFTIAEINKEFLRQVDGTDLWTSSEQKIDSEKFTKGEIVKREFLRKSTIAILKGRLIEVEQGIKSNPGPLTKGSSGYKKYAELFAEVQKEALEQLTKLGIKEDLISKLQLPRSARAIL